VENEVTSEQLESQIAIDLNISALKAREILRAFQEYFVEPLKSQLNSRGIRLLLSRKNPYLYRATGIRTCEELVKRAFSDYLSSSTETLFGNFLEAIAIILSDGWKSSTQGVDIERRVKGNGVQAELYVLKSGPAGFNSASLRDAERALQTAEGVLRQGGVSAEKFIAFTYGRKRTTFIRGIWRLSSQDFWERMGNSRDFYMRLLRACDRLTPLYQADVVQAEQRLLIEARSSFCRNNDVDWSAVMEAVSG
jgi:hypothetical protein